MKNYYLNLDSASNVKMSNFIKCQVKMKASPRELLQLALEMLCLVPSTGGLERFFFQQWDTSTLIFATGLELRKLKTYFCDAIFE